MNKEKLESVITELVVNGGNARANALEAIHAAKEKNFPQAEKLMEECKEALNKAHQFQTSLIQDTLDSDQESGADLLMVHGQDHLMDAMVVRDLAEELIEMYHIIYTCKKEKSAEVQDEEI